MAGSPTVQKPLRLAIVGCGGMSSAHATGAARLGERVQVVATVDPLIDRAQALASQFRDATASSTLEPVLDRIDAAIVITPHHTHHEIGLQLLRAGKHVLMEKPLANSEAECLDLCHAAESAGRVLMVAYPMRYHPVVRELKELVSSGALGEVFHVSIWTEQFTEYPPGHWTRSRSAMGGGQLFSHGCHYIDLLLWLLGSPVRGWHLGTSKGTPWMDGEGSSDVAVEFESGAVGYHFGTWGARGTKLGYSIHVHGTHGMLEADILGGELRLHTDSGIKTMLQVERRSKHTDKELAHFLTAVAGGAPAQTGAGPALQGLRVIWRLYQAESRGVIADLQGLALDDDWRPSGLDQLPR